MANTILFYILIFISIVLSIGYFVGRKKNRKIAFNAMEALKELIKPEDQTITNIGGVVGYHVEMEFKPSRNIKKLAGTITLLPRHSLLYLPISKIYRKFDRFYMKIELKKLQEMSEIHFLAEPFLDKYRQNLKDNSKLKHKYEQFNGRKFCYVYKDESDLNLISGLVRSTADKEYIKEISINPNGEVAILIVPRTKGNKKILEPIISWLQPND